MRSVAPAVAATVAPLLQLKRAAQKAWKLARYARAVELYERAIAAAELAMPRNSLVVAALLSELGSMHYSASQANPGSPASAESVEEMKQRVFHLLHARSQAGTLFAPTAEEVAYLAEDVSSSLPAQVRGAFFYIGVAQDMVEEDRRRVFRRARLLRRTPACKVFVVPCAQRWRWKRAACWSATRARGKRG
jgi:hypothetical protein